MEPVARNTNDKTSKSLNEIDAQQDLIPLRSSAHRAIRAELRKAGLDRSNDIEDIFQDACLIVVKVSRTGRKINNIKFFLLQVCRHSARHYMRKIIRRERIQVLFPTDLVRAVHGESQLSGAYPDTHLLEERDLILKALRRLSALDQRIINMKFVEGLSDPEMRERLGLSGVAFRTAKHRAFQRLLLEVQKIMMGKR